MRRMSNAWLSTCLSGGLACCIAWPCATHADQGFCTEKPCFLRATDKSLPRTPAPRLGTEFAMGKMRLNIPGALKKVSMPAKNLLTIKFNDGTGLTARLADNEDLLSLLPAASRVQKISIAAAKIPQIIFSQTPEDTEPTEANDRYIWRSMIIRKKLLFTGKSHLTHFDLPKINVYVANGIDGPFAMLALKEGGAYVEIQGRKFPFEAFERVITSVEVN